jgi:hypothetical protein
MDEGQKSELIDPDPFLIANLVIGAVGALGTLAQAYAAFRKPTPLEEMLASSAGIIEDGLRRELSTAIRDAEDLIRMLARQHVEPTGAPVLSFEFRYGNAPMMLDKKEFLGFEGVFSHLSLSTRSVTESVMALMRTSPSRASELGVVFNAEELNPTQRINEFYRGNMTTGEVLDSALELLKSFQRLLDRINRSN